MRGLRPLFYLDLFKMLDFGFIAQFLVIGLTFLFLITFFVWFIFHLSSGIGSQYKKNKAAAKKLINEIEKKSEEEPLWKLSQLTKISIEELKHTTGIYRKVSIKKKTGGYRELQIPNDELMQVQKSLPNL